MRIRYPDVEHEVEPITSGHRIIFSYDITAAVPGAADQYASNLSCADLKLERVLKRWSQSRIDSGSSGVKYITYLLDQDYKDGTRCTLADLEGPGEAVVSRTVGAAHAYGFHICLANFTAECEVEKDRDGTISAIPGSLASYSLLSINPLDGSLLAMDGTVQEESIISSELFDYSLWEEEQGSEPEEENEYCANIALERTVSSKDLPEKQKVQQNIVI